MILKTLDVLGPLHGYGIARRIEQISDAIADLNHQLIYSLARDITESKRAEEERERLVRELQVALGEVRELREILPICMYCKSIRNDQNYWQSVETYIGNHAKVQLSHGTCPNCYKNVFKPQLDAHENS